MEVKRYVKLGGIVMLSAMVFSGCSIGQKASPPADSPKSAPVTADANKDTKADVKKEDSVGFSLTGEVHTTAKDLIIRGKSNLKEGTLLTVLENKKGMKEAVAKVDKNGDFSIVVGKAAFTTDVDVTVKLNPLKQTKELQKVYGPQGEKLTGDNVVEVQKVKELIATATVNKDDASLSEQVATLKVQDKAKTN